MRIALGLVLALAACSPDVAPGSYYCGPERLCPDDQACDGETHLCVDPRLAGEFACGQSTETEPNDSLATAQSFGTLACSPRVEAFGCVIRESDATDFFRFDTPADCAVMQRVNVRVSSPVAFEPIVAEILDADGAVIATSEPCGGQLDGGTLEICGVANVEPSTSYAVRITGEGVADCSGDCAFNRYEMSITLQPR